MGRIKGFTGFANISAYPVNPLIGGIGVQTKAYIAAYSY
jgi:hypothetical protein